MDAESVLLRFIDQLNQRKWNELSRLLAPTVSCNDTSLSADAYLQSLRKEADSLSITTWKLDVVVHDRRTDRIGARVLLLTARAATSRTQTAAATSAEGLIGYPQHLIMIPENGKISEIRTITSTDTAVVQQSLEDVAPSTQSLGPGLVSKSAADLAEFYTSYIRCINDQTMGTDLHRYCHREVSWCGRILSLDEYGKLMEDSFEAISGLVFSVRDLIVDEERQRICSRIEFTGTPVRPYAGAEPNGKAVRFAEHAIYWLEAGKIARVVTVIDWQSYRKQLGP